MRAGDRVYFDTKRLGYGVMDHTGIYIGNGKFLHATPRYVRIQNLNQYHLRVAKRRRDVT